MNETKEPQKHIETSVKAALQGLAHWMSYRQILCHDHHINEGALVAELVLLLRAKLNNNFKILNEKEYGKNDKKKMDIEIVKIDDKNKEKKTRIAIIEVKRFGAGRAGIDNDIKKITKAKKKNENKDVLCYLIITSEEGFPSYLMDKNEKSTKKNLPIESGFSATIRTYKSTNVLNRREGRIPKVNYCSLLNISKINQG
ncbi:MAG: hypothetical protein FWB90_06905 [Fibromonadales bacterium]|nr:hypothetical protein [Fibromonadales bacterium]